jgi:hypothetical protein
MTVTFIEVSSDWSRHNQSWTKTCVFKTIHNPGKQSASVRTEIRDNAYERQSHAKISAWSDSQGWVMHTDIPADDWYHRAPSYTRDQIKWSDAEWQVFDDLEEDLLRRFAAGVLLTEDIAIERRGK